jgi:hypothetical protein
MRRGHCGPLEKRGIQEAQTAVIKVKFGWWRLKNWPGLYIHSYARDWSIKLLPVKLMFEEKIF